MRYLLGVLLLMLLAACSGQEQTSPASQDASGSGDSNAQAGAAALPGGVTFDIPSQLRSDKLYETKAGATRRKLVYELLEATPDQAQSQVTVMLARAGYKAGEAKPGKDGKVGVVYRKKKAPTLTATFYPGLAKKPANPAAKSMVAFSWQTKKAPKKK